MATPLKLNDYLTVNVFKNSNYTVIRGCPIDCFENLYQKLNKKYKEKYYFIVLDAALPIFNDEIFSNKKLQRCIQKAKNQKKDIIFIFEMIFEAPSYKYNLKTHYNSIIQHLGIPKENIIIWSGAHHHFGDDVQFVTEEFVGLSDDQFNKNYKDLPSHHFVSLSRIPRPHRLISTQLMWEKNLDKFGFISLCSDPEYENSFDRSLVKQEYIHRIPSYIDGIIDAENPRRDCTDLKISGALINVVQETSFDHDIQKNFWNTVFLTEKTFRPFVSGQIPIFITVKDHAKTLRKYGFDLFDDLIDHSYDSEDDGLVRITQAVDQLEKICSIDIDVLKEFKQNNLERFEQNFKIAQKIYSGGTEAADLQINKILETLEK